MVGTLLSLLEARLPEALPTAPQPLHPCGFRVCLSYSLCPQVSNQGQSLNTLGSAFLNIMWPHEIANGKWLLYPMRVELEGGQGPGQRGLCSPRPNILYLVRLRRGGLGAEAGWVGSDSGKGAAGLGACG